MKTNTPKPNQPGRPERAKASRGIFPELRFREFTDEWQEKKLGINSTIGISYGRKRKN